MTIFLCIAAIFGQASVTKTLSFSYIILSLPALLALAASTRDTDLQPAASNVELAAAGLTLIQPATGPILIDVRKHPLAAARAAAARHDCFPVTTAAGAPVSGRPVSGIKRHRALNHDNHSSMPGTSLAGDVPALQVFPDYEII
jgi:hypothetical protein